MNDIKQAYFEFTHNYLMPNNGVYSVGIMSCEDCGGKYLEVSMDTNDKELMHIIPDSFKGFKIKKVLGDKPVAQSDLKPTKVKITKNGKQAIKKAPIVGGYIPETIYVLLLISDGKPHEIERLRKSKRRLSDLDKLIKYLETKSLVMTNEDDVIKNYSKSKK